jgi:transposase
LEAVVDIKYLHKQGLSDRAIARKLGISPRTVKKYRTSPELVRVYNCKEHRPTVIDNFKGNVEQWLSEDSGYTATWIYDRLKPMGYAGGYAVVMRYVRQWKTQYHQIAYLRFETEPGVQAQVDFGEFTITLPDGNIRKVYCFAMILGYSRMLYCELVNRCDLMTFLDCHIHAFEFFGGVPQEILYDRMKNVFIGRIAGRDKFNSYLTSFALHYGFRPAVTPPYAPWVKGKVERPYHFIREGFWRGYGFNCLERANVDLQHWLGMKAERIHGTTHERVIDRFEREKPLLTLTPPKAFDTSYKIYRDVYKDCTVAFDGNHYMLPHTLVGHSMLLRAKDRTLRIFEDDKLVISYSIPENKGNTVAEPAFREALKKDREMNRRKYDASMPGKGRAYKATYGPTVPSYALSVEQRGMDIYSQIGGEVING